LVFIPGWLLPAEIWTPQLQGLSQDYHVIALDPRCQGLSEITAKGNDPLRQSRDIQELLDHLHLSSVVLVGWSHGGFQVLAYLGQFGPDRLYAAVLVDSALAAASSSPGNGTARTRFLENFKRDKTAATRGFVWGLFKKSPPLEFFHRIAAAADRVPAPMALALMNNYFPGENYQPNMPTIKQIPLLYAVTPKYTSQAEYLLSVDPQARVEFFKGTGHALFVDDADHFNDTLRDFLRHAGTYPGGWPHAAPKAGTTPNYR
jgi:microsomal epoxide hydrolase